MDPSGAGAYVDPPSPAAPPAGIPASLWAKLTRPPTFDTFAGSETSNRSAQQWVDIVVGTGTVTQGVNADVGDTVSNGLLLLDATASPVAASAAAKRSANAVAVDGFGAPPRMDAVRMRLTTVAAPSATEYSSALVELSRRTDVSLPPVDGIEIVFDPTVGVAGYVTRCWSGGVPQDDTQVILTHDNEFHVVGFFVDANGIVPFVDGVAFPLFVPVALQPTIACAHGISTISTPVGSVTSPQAIVDWALYV